MIKLSNHNNHENHLHQRSNITLINNVINAPALALHKTALL